MSGLADFTDKVLKFTHFLFEAETGMLAACAEAMGMKFDQKIRKIMTFSAEDQARLSRAQAPLLKESDMDEKTRIAAGIAEQLQGMKYDDKRLAEIAAEVEVLNDAVRKAAAAPHLRRRARGVREPDGARGPQMRNDDLALCAI